MRRTHCLWFVVVFGLSIAHEAFAPARLFAQGKNVGPAPLTPEQQKEVDEAIWARERRELIWQVPAFIAVLAFATGVFWLPWLLDLRRTKTLAPVAHDLRMKFNGRATGSFSRALVV